MDEQALQNQVKTYLDEGKSETEILNALKNDHKTIITFMELKFVLAELDEIVGKENEGLDDLKAEKAKLSAELEEERSIGGTTDIGFDEMPSPGSRLSGNASLKSGATINWSINGAGQLGLLPGGEGEPTEADMGDFQREIQGAIQRKMGLF